MFSFLLPKKFNQKQSMLFLYSLKASLQLGITLSEAVELQAKSIDGNLGKLTKHMVHLITIKKIRIAKVFHDFGILSKEEKVIIENTGNIRESIGDIIEMREINGAFNKTLASLTVLPMISVVIGLLLANRLVPIFQTPLNAIYNIVKLKGVDLSETMQIPDFFWYINHFDLIMPILYIYIVSIVSLILLYIYLRNYKPYIVYKLLKLSSYDDIPFILMYMRALNKTGLPPIKIADVLSKGSIKQGWKVLFYNIKNAIQASKPLYGEFQKYGFPKEITNFMKYAEEGKSFWENIDNLIAFAMEKNENGNKMVRKYLGGMSTLISYAIIIYFIIGVFIMIIQIQTVSTAMMG